MIYNDVQIDILLITLHNKDNSNLSWLELDHHYQENKFYLT